VSVDFDATQVGRTILSEEFRVNTVRLAQFAAATNDANPLHAEGRVAPPVFAHVPVMQATVESLLGVTRQFAFHGQHDFHFRQPIRPGLRLCSAATVRGIQPTPAGVSVVIKTATSTHAGELLNEQYFTGFVAKAGLPRAVGEGAPAHRLAEAATEHPPAAEATMGMDADQTRRYADAARDYSDYTLDLAAARAKGLAGLLVHGMCTLAFAGRAVVDKACAGDSTRLMRLACRFSRPLYLVPGQSVRTRIWALGRRDGRATFGFESQDAAGQTVIRHGLAEVAA
jgi:acyl dehydratase